MEARYVTLLLAGLALNNVAATYSSRNFVVTAPTSEMAQQIAERAEESRVQIAQWWLGYELKPWYRPCKVTVQVGQMGSGGATTFSFDRGEVGDWNMNVQGSFERIMDSVIPHEVSHTVFACHFKRPLPRWADEGAATIIEHPVERERQKQLVLQILNTTQRIPLRELLEIKEYPSEMQKVLNLYAEGYTLCEWLVFHWGQKNYLAFVNAAHQEGWDRAVAAHYPFKNVEDLEQAWLAWIREGMKTPEQTPEQQSETLLVQQESVESERIENSTEGEVRGQAPDVRSVESEPVETPNLHRATKAPQARRRSAVVSSGSRSSKAPTTGDVVLGEQGDLLATVEALSETRTLPNGGMRAGVEGSSRQRDRKSASVDEESVEVRELDARRSSGSRMDSAAKSRRLSGQQRNPEASLRESEDSVEVGDNSLRPEPRPSSRLREITPDQSETQDRRSALDQRSSSRGSEGTASTSRNQRYRRSRVTDWNAPVSETASRRTGHGDWKVADREDR